MGGDKPMKGINTKNMYHQFFYALQFSLILTKAVGISNLSWFQTLIPSMLCGAITVSILAFAIYITIKNNREG